MPRPAKINHVAFVVRSIETALAFWRDALGLELETLREVPAEQSRVAYLPAGNARIELVEPTTQDSGVARFLAKRGAGMHHVCLEVAELGELVERLRARGVRLIDEAPKLGSDGTRYVFVHPESTGGVLLELYERPG